MFSFLSKKEKEKYSLIIDIQSGLVRGALVSKTGNGFPIIKHVKEKIIPRRIHTNGNYINKMMLHALSIVTSDIIENYQISKIDIILSSPWVLSHSKSIKINFENDTIITDKIITQIVDEERKKLENIFITGHKEIPNINNDLNYIEQKVFDIKLNGYVVNNYIGKSVRSMEISVAMTLSSKIIIKRISDVLRKISHSKNYKYHSGLLLNYTALLKMMPDKTDYIYVHSHSELTDVILVKKGMCANISSFPIGTSNLTHRIAHAFKHNDEVADSMIKLYTEGKLEESEMKKITKIVGEYSNGWLALYKKVLESSIEVNSIPRLIFLSAHANVNILNNIIKMSTTEDTHIIDFNLENFDSKITFEKPIEMNQLIKMYALALDDML